MVLSYKAGEIVADMWYLCPSWGQECCRWFCDGRYRYTACCVIV